MKKDTRDLINALSSGPVRQYLTDHEHSDLRRIILENKEILGIPTAQLFDQITLRKKAKDKLPLYYNTPGVIYPPTENFEQSSSERTASFKARLVAALLDSGTAVAVDLTGGFGVDALFLSRTVASFHYVETNLMLLELARYNHQLFGAGNISYHNTSAEEFLKTTAESFSLIYVDPSRRKQGGKRVAAFEDSQPELSKLAATIFGKTKWLLIKASPLMDLQSGILQIPYVTRVYVVSVNNECKEVLFLCEKESNEVPAVEAVNLLADGSSDSFIFTFPEERELSIASSDPLEFLYEPNASILKAGAFKSVASRYGVKKIHPNTHLYTSSEPVNDFPGRKFRIEQIIRPEFQEIRKYLPDGQANVMTRNYPLTADQLKKRVRLNDGGEKFLIGFSGMKKKYVVVASKF